MACSELLEVTRVLVTRVLMFRRLAAHAPSCRRGTCWCGTSSSCAGPHTGTHLTPRRPSCTCWPRWTSGRRRAGTGALSCTACECWPCSGREEGLGAQGPGPRSRWETPAPEPLGSQPPDPVFPEGPSQFPGCRLNPEELPSTLCVMFDSESCQSPMILKYTF